MAKASETKKKRKLNAKGRKVIRRSIAGVLMASALIVAAIPEDRSGVASAAPGDTNPPLNYSADSAEARNSELAPPSNVTYSLAKTSTDRAYEAYDVRQIDGNWTILSMYQYYVPASGSSTQAGVIYKYNDTYNVSELNLASNIYSGFMVVTVTEYNDYVTNTISKLRFYLDKSPVEYGTKTGSDGEGNTYVNDPVLVKKYFPDKYADFQTEYNAKLSDWKTANPDATYTPTLTEIGMLPLDLSGATMVEDNKRIYYCENNTITNTGELMQGCTLLPVRNYAPGKDYLDFAGATCTMPTNDQVYLVIVNDNTASTAQTVEVNGVKFRWLSTKGIEAIGEDAFKGTEKVDKLVVGDGIAYIGDRAFQGSFIKNVEFSGVTYIGNQVFQGCSYLEDITLTNSTTTIGKEAFEGCNKLRSVNLPEGMKNIGFGAFANCPVLESVDLSQNVNGCTIGEYAFYDCTKLSSVKFNDDYDFAIGKAAFALSPGNGAASQLTDFKFPKSIKDYVSAANSETNYSLSNTDGTSFTSRIGDYILANRDNLKTVTMPVNFGSSTSMEYVPLNTFDMCTSLEHVDFTTGYNRMACFDPYLFEDVQNESFYVFGPDTSLYADSNGKYFANPRKSTWATSEDNSGNPKKATYVSDYIPYVYYADGKNHYEVGIGDYRYELEVNDTDNTASLLSCELIKGGVTSIPEFTIPGTVAKYNVKDMEPGCISDEIKNMIIKLNIADNSIESIDEGVFKDCAMLEEVDLGNSVKSIGKDAFADNGNLTKVTIGENIETIGQTAFADNPVLKDVIFEHPSSYDIFQSIGTDAFKTTSPDLYFTGDIIKGYAPFDYAMGGNEINTDSVYICYQSPDPTNFKVLKDDKNDCVLLIDYPHYEDLPIDIRTAFENHSPLNTSQQKQLDATRHLDVPDAVESIDLPSFVNGNNNVNARNFKYIDNINTPTFGVDYTRRDIYSDDDLADFDSVYSNEGGYHAGLFSGQMDETNELVADGDSAAQTVVKGNDWIQSIQIPGVKKIPSYAFDSCERLESIIVGSDLEDIGPSAFAGCTNLASIGTNNNPRYDYDNYILYKKLPDGSYEITTCLPARGIGMSSSEIWVESANDPLLSNVSSLNEGAFQSCSHIAKVDLSDTKIDAIPVDTFNGCKTLTEVILPDTISNIGESAFGNSAPALDVQIPSNSQISDKAFDPNSVVTIWTYKECNVTANYKPKGYDKLYVKFLGSDYYIKFLNDDLTLFETVYVSEGGNGYYPENDPTPLLPEHKDYKFTDWKFDNDQKIYNVYENRQAIAVFHDDTGIHKIKFLNDDFSVYEVVEVQDGGNGYYPSNDPTPILPEHAGCKFSHWDFLGEEDVRNVTEDRQAIAVFEDNSPIHKITYLNDDLSVFEVIEVEDGNNGIYPDGTPTPQEDSHKGYTFSYWKFYNENGVKNVTEDRQAVAIFVDDKGNTTDNSSTSKNSASSNSASSNNAKFNVIVENGAGSGTYEAGKVVTITAYSATNGMVFDKWTTSNTDIGFSNANNVSTTFIMPTHNVKVTATYKSSSGNSASKNSTSNNNANNNNSNKNNNSNNGSTSKNSTSGNGANKKGNSNTDVRVTTEAIDNSKKNLASATVAGSTDNFVIKVTDSAAASAAVEEALKAKYSGDISNIKFVAFDISLYDETGTYPIENYQNLAVTITLPIPDDLVSYAGNNKIAAVINGAIDDKAVKFTTIDGVPCMTFTANHFSPYTIYVDTSNLTGGDLDATPKTGDGIAPKWFLALGLAAFSGVLFFWKDKKLLPQSAK